MRRESHVRFSEGGGVKLPSATQLVICCRPGKLFMHITADEQLRRFRSRLTDPLKRWKLSYEDFRNRARWTEYEEAIKD